MYRNTKIFHYFVDACIYIFLLLLAAVTLYPFLNALAISLNEARDTSLGGIGIIPRAFTLENYRMIVQNQSLYHALFITVLRTVIGTAGSVLATAMFAYGLSKDYLKGRKIYMKLCLITMYFHGGLIPTYMLIRSLNLINSFWVYIIPNLISVWNMIIMRTYFRSLPEAIEESAKIDGASTWVVFFKIVMPISAPIIATIALFNGVFHWNSWFDAAIYITHNNIKPIQSILNSLINSSRFAEEIANAGAAAAMTNMNIINSRSLTMATMVATIIPIVMVYPFLQKHFAKGLMIGSVKG